jgi:hypothetical protein
MGGTAILAGVGGGLGIFGTIAGANSENQYYQYLATENEKQAGAVMQTASTQKGLVYDAAGRDTLNVRNQLKAITASQKTGLAASNISLASVTAEDIARDTFNAGNKDEAAIRYNADMQAYQIMNNAQQTKYNLLAQAKGYRQAGENKQTAGYLNAFAGLLNTGSNVASKWK